MSHIQHLIVTNLKGLTGSFDLAPITVVTGRNSRCKTAVLDAIAISLVGHLPSLGSQNVSTWELASGPLMSITADGRTFSWRKPKDSVQAKLPDGFVPAPVTMIDLEEFRSKSKAERLNAILAACPTPDQYNTANVTSRINAVAKSMPEFKATATDVVGLIAELTKHLKAWDTGLKALEKDQNGIIAGLTDVISAGAPQGSVEAEVKSAEVAYSKAGQERATMIERVNERERLEVQLAEISIEDAATLQEQLEAFEKALPAEAQGAASGLKGALTKAQQREAKAAAVLSRIERVQSQLYGKVDCPCPTCEQLVSQEVIDTIVSTLPAARKEFEDAQAAMVAATKAIRDADKAAKDANAKRAEALGQISALKGKIAGLEAARKMKADIEDRLKTLPERLDVEAKDQELADLVANLQNLQGKQKIWLQQQTRQRDCRTAQAKLAKTQSDREEAKAALAEVATTRTAIVAMVVGGLIATANTVVEPVLGQPLSWVDDDFRVGPATFGTMSGSEKMVVYAGLQIALAAKYKPKIVLMDDLGRIDPERKAGLFKAVQLLITEGVISQFVCSDAYPLQEYPGSTSLINMDAKEAA